MADKLLYMTTSAPKGIFFVKKNKSLKLDPNSFEIHWITEHEERWS